MSVPPTNPPPPPPHQGPSFSSHWHWQPWSSGSFHVGAQPTSSAAPSAGANPTPGPNPSAHPHPHAPPEAPHMHHHHHFSSTSTTSTPNSVSHRFHLRSAGWGLASPSWAHHWHYQHPRRLCRFGFGRRLFWFALGGVVTAGYLHRKREEALKAEWEWRQFGCRTKRLEATAAYEQQAGAGAATNGVANGMSGVGPAIVGAAAAGTGTAVNGNSIPVSGNEQPIQQRDPRDRWGWKRHHHGQSQPPNTNSSSLPIDSQGVNPQSQSQHSCHSWSWKKPSHGMAGEVDERWGWKRPNPDAVGAMPEPLKDLPDAVTDVSEVVLDSVLVKLQALKQKMTDARTLREEQAKKEGLHPSSSSQLQSGSEKSEPKRLV